LGVVCLYQAINKFIKFLIQGLAAKQCDKNGIAPTSRRLNVVVRSPPLYPRGRQK